MRILPVVPIAILFLASVPAPASALSAGGTASCVAALGGDGGEAPLPGHTVVSVDGSLPLPSLQPGAGDPPCPSDSCLAECVGKLTGTDDCTAKKALGFGHILLKCDILCFKDGHANSFMTTGGGLVTQVSTGCTGFSFGVCTWVEDAECSTVGTSWDPSNLCTGESWGPAIVFAVLQCDSQGTVPDSPSPPPDASPSVLPLSVSLALQPFAPGSQVCYDQDCVVAMKGVTAVWTPDLFVTIHCTDDACTALVTVQG